MADHSEQINGFVQITGVEPERAQFYLEAANWNADLALSSFYEEEGEDMSLSNPETMATPARESEAPEYATRPAGGAAPARASGKASRSGNIATLSNYEKEPEQEGGEEFFAGGSEHSGQMISGPPKKKRVSPQDLAKSVMESAKEHGAEVVDESAPKAKAAPQFTGSGYRLGETPEESKMVVQAPPKTGKDEVEVVITFWRDGFTIDDGPLRDGSTEEDKKFIKDISDGVIPDELNRKYLRGEVGVTITQKDSEYVPPKKLVKAFTGSGNRLGSPTPGITNGAGSAATAASSSAAASSASSAAAAAAPSQVQVDPSKPVTTLQIRLADGTRLVSKFNTTHTIAMIRDHINSSRPDMAGKDFYLMTSFPSKELSDESLTLEAGSLLNAVVMQRMR